MKKIKKIIQISIILIITAVLVGCSNNTEEKNNTEHQGKTETIIITKNQQGTIYKEYDLGNIKKDTKKFKKDFIIKNETEKTIIINYAVTSCDCTIGVIEDEKGNKSDNFSKSSKPIADMEIQSNKSVTIHLNLDLTGEDKGTWIKILRVFDDYDEKLIEIEMSYNIAEK